MPNIQILYYNSALDSFVSLWMHFIFLFSSLSPLKFPEFPPFKIFKRLIPPPQSPILLPKKIPAKSETTRAKLNPPHYEIHSLHGTQTRRAAGSLGIIQPDLFDVEKSRRGRERRERVGKGKGRKYRCEPLCSARNRRGLIYFATRRDS